MPKGYHAQGEVEMARRGRGDVARLIGAARRDRAGLLVTTALTAAVLAVVALPADAQLAPNTQPTGGVVVAGSALIGATASTTTVTQSSARAAVNWQSFNLGSAATVNFVQPSASAVTLNRVLAPDPSVIAGHIHANGGIVLTNPAGVVFTHGAEVNAASVLVSAPGITNRDFMAGRMRFDIPARPGARIVNAGHITVQAAGLAALVAPEVANSGVISAKLGHVILAGGAAAETLDLYGDGLVSLDVTPEAQKVRLANGTKATALVTNSGTIIASGGSVLLTARQADGLVQDLVDAGGTIAANSVGAHTGTIAIRGIGGSIRIPGTLLAQGKAPGTTGGVIALDATGTVTVADGARINASGAAGGGTVAIGTTLARARGGPGTAATLTARAVTVAPRAEIAADATASGNGGRVSVLSLGATRMAGTVTARGGPHGGNGGSVEISGENLSLDGRVDTSAPLGATGSILLDPYDLTIVSSGTSNTDVSATGVAFSAGGTAPGDTDTVSASAIEALSGNVTLQAIHDLEIATNLKLTGVNQSLTLQAGNDLKIDSGFLVSAPGAIEMDAASLASPTPNAAGAITVNGTVNATGALTLNAGSGGISVPGSISGDGLSLTTGGAIVVGGTASAGAGGSVSLSAGAGGIILNGSISGDAVVLTTPGSAFDASGAISATTLSGTTGNGASLTGPNNMIGTLAAFDSSAGGTFNLEDKSPLTVTGKVAVPNGGFLAIEADTLAISGGTLYAPGGTVQLAPYTAMNAIALFGNGSAGAGTLAITKDDIGGLVAAVLQIGTAAGGPIIIGDATGPAVSVPPGLALDLVSGSGVTEIGALSVGELEGTVGSATLTAANNITTLGNFSASSGGFSLTEDKTIPLLVSGPVSVPSGQTIALTADGIALGSGGSLSAPNGTVTIASAKPGLSVDLTTGQASAAVGTFSLGDTSPNTAAISAATLAVGAADGGGITVTGAIALPDIGLLDLLSGGAVSETSADSLSVGTLTATVASANLTGNNVIDTLGAITATGGAFSLTNQVPLGITGAVRAVGNGVTFIINGGGNIAEQTGGSITAGTLTGSAGSASFNDANQVGTLGAFAATNGSFSLTETAGQPLAITGVVSVPAGQRIALTADGIAVGPAGSLAAAGASVALASATPSLAVDVTTGRATASAGTFSLGDAVADTAAIAAATLAIGATSGGEISVTGPIALPDVALLDLLSGGALSETTADSLSVGAFVAEVARANLIGGNAIGTLGAITAPGGFTLTDEENLTLAGPIRATGGAVQLNDARFAISESGGSISAETLGIGAPTAVVPSASLTGNNVIGTLDAVSVSGGFTLANAENLTLAGAVNAGNVQLNDPDFAITEQGGSIETGFFTGSGASATLNGANQIGTLGAFAASNGGFSLTEAPGHALLVTGVVSVTTGQTIALTADGIAVGATGSLDATGGSATLASATNAIPIDVTTGQASAAIGTFSLGDPVSDTAAIAAATLAVGAVDGGALTVKGVIALTSVTLLDLLSGGALSETNADSLSVGTLAADVASASLIGSNAIGTLGAITATGDFTLADQENLTLAGPIRATGGAVQLNDPGFAITEQGGSVAADILGIGTPGSVVQSASLSGNNVIGTLDSVSVSGGFTLANAKDLTLAGLIDAGSVQLSDPGFAITEPGGSIEAGNLGVGTPGPVVQSASLSGNNVIGTLDSVSVSGGFTLADAKDLTLAGLIDAGSVQLNDPGFAITEHGGSIDTSFFTGSGRTAVLTDANQIGTLGAFSAPGGFTLATTNGLAVAGSVDSGGAGIDLVSGGSITELAGGTLIGGELLGFAGGGALAGAAGTASFVNTNTLASLGNFTALGGFTLADAGSLALTGALEAGSANVVLTGGAAVSEPSGSITATMLSGTLASAALGGANRISELANFSAAGGFSLSDASPLTLSGPVSAGSGEALFTLGGSLVQSSAGSLTAGTLAGSASLIDLADPTNRIASLGAITSPGGLTLATATGLGIAGTIATGVAPISLSSEGAIAEIAGGTLVGGGLTGSASAAAFANTNSIAELGSFTAPGGFTLDNGGDLPIAGPLDAGSATALLIAGGSLFETGGAIIAGTLTGSAGNVSLTNAANRIAGLGAFTSGAFNLNDGENLAVIGTVTGNPIGLTVTGNLALGSGAGNAVLSSTGAVFLIASGAVTEPAGAIDATILTGSAGSVSLPGANRAPLLGPFTTAGPFLLNVAEPALTVNGPLSAGSASLAAAGNLVLAGPVSADAVTLSAGGAISESGGSISAGTLAGSASDATLTAANTIATLGAFSVPGTLLLADETPLAVAGPVSAAFFGLTDPSGVSFTGATDVGTLSITAGGSITEPTGTVTAALLEGSAEGLVQLGPDAPAGSASITTLGPFGVSTGTFTLTNSIPLTITGPLSANDFAITAPGNITVTNASITTIGLPASQQSGVLPARPGSYFDVTGPGGRFLELGRTTINPDGGPATVRIQLDPAGGLISFADLVAPTTTLILDTGAGTAIGTIDIAALTVLGNLGSATLSGMVADLSGAVASSKATISPFQSAHYRLNACPLMSVNCIFIAPMSVPEGNPLSGLAIVSAPPNQQDTDLLLPNVAAQDY